MSFISDQRWANFKNSSGESIPPFAILWISGGDVARDKSPYLKAAKPDWLGGQLVHWINSPVKISPDGYGTCTNDFPALAAFDRKDGLPQPGEIWGPVKGEWKLRKGAGGFRIAGMPITDDGMDRVLVTREPRIMLIGKAKEDISGNDTGEILVLGWTTNPRGVTTLEEPDDESLFTIKVMNSTSGAVTEDSRIICVWDQSLIDDNDARGWVIFDAGDGVQSRSAIIRISLFGPPTGGTWGLDWTLPGGTISLANTALQFDATASDVEAAISVSPAESGDFTVTGSVLGGLVITVATDGQFSDQPISLPVLKLSQLEGVIIGGHVSYDQVGRS